ncbi:cytochrome o ubiquinol oxidase subunit IV [Jiella sp. M17.18]|uniref:cytochrome o ubiquinol oxidase subunit IV n=1 Tax=Jiella sp. M17.18 TaxID=3234247 RepID=UPI0034DE1FE8
MSSIRHEEDFRRERRNYFVGLVLAILLTLAAFGSVAWTDWPRMTILWIILGCAIVQIVVHFHYFLHINLAKSKREDLQLILFSFMIVTVMAGGTIWILYNLDMRMMG